MPLFNWIGGSGSLDDPNNWDQPDPLNPRVLNAADGDDVIIDGGDIELTGNLDVINAQLDASNIDLEGDINADSIRVNGNVQLSSTGNFTGGDLIDAGNIVANGSTGSNALPDIGQVPTSVGVLTLENSAKWNADGIMTVGDAGNGTLNVQSGSSLIVAGQLTIGSAAGSQGVAVVDGANTTVNVNGTGLPNSGDLVVGYEGNGALTVQNFAAGSSLWTAVGFLTGSVGNFTLDHSATWTADALDVGNQGYGQLYVQLGL
jgi:T5SS/PEP-CTERM-associated repeat protein